MRPIATDGARSVVRVGQQDARRLAGFRLVIRVSPAKTAEPIEMQLEGADSCGRGCTLAPHDEYDGGISAAAAMRPADTITVATCKR